MDQPPQLHPPPRRNTHPWENDIDDAVLVHPNQEQARPSTALPPIRLPPAIANGDSAFYAALSFSRTSGLRHGLLEKRVEIVYEQGRALELKPWRWLAIFVLSFVGWGIAHFLYTHL